MIRDEISEYPYSGKITHVFAGKGMASDESVVIYEGEMDSHTQTAESGTTLQTSSYIISIPLKKNDNDEYIIPQKGDKIELTRYWEIIHLTIDNVEPSQLGGISIYATRNSW